MTDKELLELAAKVAGIGTLIWHEEMQSFWTQYEAPQYWNPLTDDGDALRLAVKLDINVHTKGDCVYQNNIIWFYNPVDIYAATRRAIVRAAAEIGKGMK